MTHPFRSVHWCAISDVSIRIRCENTASESGLSLHVVLQ